MHIVWGNVGLPSMKLGCVGPGEVVSSIDPSHPNAEADDFYQVLEADKALVAPEEGHIFMSRLTDGSLRQCREDAEVWLMKTEIEVSVAGG